MRLISSKSTWCYKRAFPGIWFGFLALAVLVLVRGVVDGSSAAGWLLIPLGMMALGYAMLRSLVFRMMDAVWIDGDDLVVRKRDEEDRFPMSHFVDVDHTFLVGPEHI